MIFFFNLFIYFTSLYFFLRIFRQNVFCFAFCPTLWFLSISTSDFLDSFSKSDYDFLESRCRVIIHSNPFKKKKKIKRKLSYWALRFFGDRLKNFDRFRMSQIQSHRFYDNVSRVQIGYSSVTESLNKYFADQFGQPFSLCKFKTLILI